MGLSKLMGSNPVFPTQFDTKKTKSPLNALFMGFFIFFQPNSIYLISSGS
jgi:hypothetical protein